ncbi:hypothetical protein BKA82DRAFT_4130421, partial [Pisolithus tinctorius]
MGLPGGFGSILIGALMSALLYGVTNLQTYVYYMHYSEDASTTKVLVAAVWVLDTLHVVFVCHMVYYYLITSYGVPTNLEHLTWSFSASVLVHSFVISIVQLFFVRKIHYLCRHQLRWLVTTPIILSVIVHFVFGIATVVVTLINNALSAATHNRLYTSLPAVSAMALAEVLITTSLCVLLYQSGSRSAVPRTKNLLNTLIIYAVNRCLLTLLVVVAEVTVVRMRPHVVHLVTTHGQPVRQNTNTYIDPETGPP